MIGKSAQQNMFEWKLMAVFYTVNNRMGMADSGHPCFLIGYKN